jgi:polynucleotide 5'-hydroxyl-kinase GRC3/NOL9
MLIRAPASNLPYFNPLNFVTLSPQYSRCVGLALVRGIDIARQRLQLLTPVGEEVMRDITEHGRQVVLISGKFDTPGWAYTEGCHPTEKNEVGKSGAEVSEVPWVQKLHDSSGRGIGARVWRVRRDLGKSDGG